MPRIYTRKAPDRIPRKERACRRCGVRLTVDNARTYDGRWVGACRTCETAESTARKRLGRPAA